jgi:hypothetical protein
LQLIADQSAGAKAKAAADGRARTRMTHSRADQATRRRAAEGANAGAFLTCAQWSTGTTCYQYRSR